MPSDSQEIMIDSLKYCIANTRLRLFEYVIMPSHIHLIAQHLEGKLLDILRDMKGFTAKEILKAVKEPGESAGAGCFPCSAIMQQVRSKMKNLWCGIRPIIR